MGSKNTVFSPVCSKCLIAMALTQFIKIDGQKLDTNKEKLNEIFERCCAYIKRHINPMEIHNEPRAHFVNK